MDMNELSGQNMKKGRLGTYFLIILSGFIVVTGFSDALAGEGVGTKLMATAFWLAVIWMIRPISRFCKQMAEENEKGKPAREEAKLIEQAKKEQFIERYKKENPAS